MPCLTVEGCEVVGTAVSIIADGTSKLCAFSGQGGHGVGAIFDVDKLWEIEKISGKQMALMQVWHISVQTVEGCGVVGVGATNPTSDTGNPCVITSHVVISSLVVV